MTSGDHAGRVALVTGASKGIGRGAAVELARQGSAVAVHGSTHETTAEVVEEIVAAGGRAIAVPGPIDDPETMRSAVATTVTAFGRLDTLVTSAGIQRYGDVVSTSLATWDEVFDVNVRGVFLALHASMPALRESGSGSVAIVASVQATATQAQVAAYTASKGALVALARAIAVDEAAYGVRVNSVSPGSVDTPMLRAAAATHSDGSPEAVERLVAQWGTAHALGRVGLMSEVGEAIAFVTGPRASFITGSDLRVDGGLLARLAAPLPDKES